MEDNSEKLLKESFYIRIKNELVKVYVNDIIAFESKLHYVVIHTLNFKLTIYWSLMDIKKLLLKRVEFIQVHRSYIVSEDHIKKITGNYIELSNQMMITVGRLYRKDFETFIKAKLL